MSAKPHEVLDIRVDDEAGRIVCWLAGDLDTLNAPRLRTLLAEYADRDCDAVVDLSKLEFIDSSGLGVLVGALKRFQAGDHRLALRRPTAALQRVLEITGMDRAFTIEN